MPDRPTSDPKQFIQGAPVLHTRDVLAAVAYYRDILGFTCDFGDEAYAVVWRDNSAIHFVRKDEGAKGIQLLQWVQDVDAYHREVVARGAVVAGPPIDQPYDQREFTVRDPNGIDVVFSQSI